MVESSKNHAYRWLEQQPLSPYFLLPSFYIMEKINKPRDVTAIYIISALGIVACGLAFLWFGFGSAMCGMAGGRSSSCHSGETFWFVTFTLMMLGFIALAIWNSGRSMDSRNKKVYYGVWFALIGLPILLLSGVAHYDDLYDYISTEYKKRQQERQLNQAANQWRTLIEPSVNQLINAIDHDDVTLLSTTLKQCAPLIHQVPQHLLNSYAAGSSSYHLHALEEISYRPSLIEICPSPPDANNDLMPYWSLLNYAMEKKAAAVYDYLLSDPILLKWQSNAYPYRSQGSFHYASIARYLDEENLDLKSDNDQTSTRPLSVRDISPAQVAMLNIMIKHRGERCSIGEASLQYYFVLANGVGAKKVWQTILQKAGQTFHPDNKEAEAQCGLGELKSLDSENKDQVTINELLPVIQHWPWEPWYRIVIRYDPSYAYYVYYSSSQADCERVWKPLLKTRRLSDAPDIATLCSSERYSAE